MSRSLAIAVTLLAGSARANPLDLFGIGGRWPALAGAAAALADDASAAYYNPAGLALGARPTFLAGYRVGVPRLNFDGRLAPVEAARGVNLGLSIPREVEGTTLSFGVALYFPDQRVVRIRTLPATEPRFAQYDNRPHRIAIHPALGWRPWPWLAVGAGVSILSDAGGRGADLDLALDLDRATDPKAQRATASIDVELPTRAAPLLGLWLRPHDRLRAGLVWRGALSLDLSVDTRVAIDAALLRGRALSGLSSTDYYSPSQLSLGVAVDVTSAVTVSAEATWYRWSAAPSPLAAVRALLDLGLSLDVVQVSIPREAYQPSDIVVPRLGVEARFSPCPKIGVTARGGASFEPSPYPRQTGPMSLADNDKLVLAAGAGLEIRDLGEVLRGPVRVDAYVQSHLLRERLHPKDEPLAPVPTFHSGGALWSAGIEVGVSF
jgi:hypothetical protein